MITHYGSNGAAECGAEQPALTKDTSKVTCPTCRGWLPIVAPPRSRIVPIEEHNGEVAPEPLEVLIDRLGVLFTELLTEVRRLRSDLREANESRSSATIKTSTRGHDLECKSYDDDHLEAALDDAITQYARGMLRLKALDLNGWQETLDGLRERVREGTGK